MCGVPPVVLGIFMHVKKILHSITFTSTFVGQTATTNKPEVIWYGEFALENVLKCYIPNIFDAFYIIEGIWNSSHCI